jgi:hypothetical protein
MLTGDHVRIGIPFTTPHSWTQDSFDGARSRLKVSGLYGRHKWMSDPEPLTPT